MKRCIFCGKENEETNVFCYNCGEKLNENNSQDKTKVKQEIIDKPITNNKKDNHGVRCPNCNSKKIAYLTKSSDGFSGSNACCGYIIFGPLGLLCGLSGKRESLTVRKCMNCGYEF
ncbi:MAG: hypothetical protein ACOCUD_02005 [Bacillota bacterium]